MHLVHFILQFFFLRAASFSLVPSEDGLRVGVYCPRKGSLMRNLHDKDNSQPRRISPWAEFSEQRRASALAYDDISFETRQAFRVAQQEAYEQWAAWDEMLGKVHRS